MFSRDELLGGLPARRASTLLFAIESRTALLVARDRRAMATYETDRTAAEKEQAFLAALGEGRTPPLKPTIQDLDRHAGDWEDLLPADAEGRAALIRRIADKYGWPAQAITLRRALGSDDPAVAAAYQRQTGTSLAAVGAGTLPWRERWRWFRTRAARRLENLPPFWLAFALTLTETVGGGILALPIAFAGLGPLPAAALLVGFGLINVLTVAALVESITRNGPIRYGSSYFGRLVGDYLGRPGHVVLVPALLLLNAVGFLVALVGFGATLQGATGVPIAVWAGVLFAVNLVFLWRESFNATVASALVIGFVCIGLIISIGLLAFANSRPDALSGPAAGVAFDVSTLELVFGVALLVYFGHTSAGNAAKVVLARDPSGRALLWGNVAAMLCAIALYVFAVFTIGLALDPQTLVGYAGTAITPLADRVGPIVNVLGSIFVVLAIGLGSIYLSLGLYNQMAEFLPAARSGATEDRTTGRTAQRSRILTFLTHAAPVGLIFVVVELLAATGEVSFTASLSLVGTLTLPLLGGVLPMLMLVAARRKGDRVPGRIVALAGHPVMVAATIGIFSAAVLAYGLFIWTRPLERAAALAVAVVIVVLAIVTWRRGAYRPRTVVEYRLEPGRQERGFLSITGAGRAMVARLGLDEGGVERQLEASDVVIADPGRFRGATIRLPAGAPSELKVWTHRVTGAGDSTAVASNVILGSDGLARRAQVGDSGDGFVIVENHGGQVRLEPEPGGGRT